MSRGISDEVPDEDGMVDCMYQKWPHIIFWFTCTSRVLVIPLKKGSLFPSQWNWMGFFVIVLWIKWGRSNSVWEMRIGYKRLYSFCQDLSLLDISLWSLEPPHKNPAAPKLLPWRDHVKRTSRWKDVSERPQLFQFNQSSQPKCQTHVWGSLQMSPVLPYLTANTWNPE